MTKLELLERMWWKILAAVGVLILLALWAFGVIQIGEIREWIIETIKALRS